MSDDFLQVTVGKFIFRVKPGYLYTEAGVWAALDDASGVARVGLTDFRQQSSGDVVFVELPAAGRGWRPGSDLGKHRDHQSGPGGARAVGGRGDGSE